MAGRLGNTKFDSGWLAAASTEVTYDGIQLTTTHPPTAGPLTQPWMKAEVPGTVLGTLVKNKMVPDPFYGLENEKILDIGVSGRKHYTYWFFKSFSCNLSKEQYADLNFRGINYSAEMYLNGDKTELPKGMFRRHIVEVSNKLNRNGENLLAVLVHPPDYPGKIPEQGGQGGDHEIGKNVSTQYVQGWDWIISIADRNTGLYDEVSVSVTGPVKIIDPHLLSTLHDNYKRASFHATMELQNKSTTDVRCFLKMSMTLELDGDICLVEHIPTQDLSISSGAHVSHTFPKKFFYKPELWWPNGMGKQPLYNVVISVEVEGYGESDSWSHHFGFREIKSHVDKKTGGRLFQVNGENVFIRGGNWTVSDGLLRLSKARYETEIKYHASMNLNMIRCWGGGLTERPDFYHYCDIYGLLVWEEFWITGDVDGRGVPYSNPNGPLDHKLFMSCVRDTVKLLRNHPSLAIWVGGNEQTPPHDINMALKRELRLFSHEDEDEDDKKDPSTFLDGEHYYVPGSLLEGFADGQGQFTDGPYTIQDPVTFFKDSFYKYGFNPEVGSVGMPVAATIRATMPPEGWEIPMFKEGSEDYVANDIWEYHKYHPYSNPDERIHDQILLYGIPTNLDEFCFQAQLANYIQYKALLEGWNSRMWTKYTGVLIWKTQNPWTGLRGQFYDHLLDQTAGFYGCRSAAEPIHVQLNLDTYFIEVVNTTSEKLFNSKIEVSVWDLEGRRPYYKVIQIASLLPKQTTGSIRKMKYPKRGTAKPVYFLVLKLYNEPTSSLISRNFYWLHLAEKDYGHLKPFKKKRIPLKITSKLVIKGSVYEIEMHILNTSVAQESRSLILTSSSEKDTDVAALCAPCEIKEKCKKTVLEQIFSYFLNDKEPIEPTKVTIIDGNDVGVAFFLQFSVHKSKTIIDHEEEKDRRILPVHYSDNYISLVPGEYMRINISFHVPVGVTPVVKLTGWNYGIIDIAI